MSEKLNYTQINKGRAVLAQLLDTKQISPEGKAWLIFALDPFHDKDIKHVEGIPDAFGGKSVVCSVVQEIQIRKPDPIVGNWGVRIATYPVASRQILAKGAALDNFISTTTDGPYIIAPVQITYAPDGLDFDEFGFNADSLEIPNAFTKGPFKVGAMGLEVINTTSDLHRQGLVTCARMNQTSLEPYTAQAFNPLQTNWVFSSYNPIRTVPVNLKEMVLLTGNTGWKAAEGAYSVIALRNQMTVAPMSQPRYPLLLSGDYQPMASNLIPCASPAITVGPLPTFGPLPNYTKIGPAPGVVPMDSSVIMFTGLSAESTLTIRARWMIERYPNDNEPEIVVLARDSPAFDPIALEIYSQVMQTLPAAVMFSENPQGEWWKHVLSAIADVVGSGLLAIPHPVAKAAGAAVLAGNKLLMPDESTMKSTVGKNGQLKPTQRKAAKKRNNTATTVKPALIDDKWTKKS